MIQLNLFDEKINAQMLIDDFCNAIRNLPLNEKVNAINEARKAIHRISPFSSEPIDLVLWVPVVDVAANDYNPNSVAPPEMELLRHSINHDGYTQPVVTWESEDGRQVIDGFHRTRVCREMEDVNQRVKGHLPVVSIKDDCAGRNDRIASTIRHNRARGKHKVESMSDIVIELKKRNWSDDRIGRELGMDPDEVLRLCQVSGLADVFADQEFSKSWDIGDGDGFDAIDEAAIDAAFEPEDGRIYHHFERWECHRHRFYETTGPGGMKQDECERKYAELLSDEEKFREFAFRVVDEWKFSCEHYLSNEKMNRIAWIGQASLALAFQIPSCFRGGYNLLSKEQQKKADGIALDALNRWLLANGRNQVSMEQAASKTQADLY